MAGKLSQRKRIASKITSGLGGRIKVIHDDNSCAICISRDGQYKDNSQLPPYHENCRCTVVR